MLTQNRMLMPGLVLMAFAMTLAAPPASATTAIDGAALFADPGLETLASIIENRNLESSMVGEFLERAHARNLTAAQVRPVLHEVIGLADAGLPARPVLSRYLQGLAKGVSLDRIQAAAASVQARLRRAAERLEVGGGQWMEDADLHTALIDHVAYALEVGVTTDAIDRSIALIHQEPEVPEDKTSGDPRSPILALSYLVYAGVESERSFELLEAAWDHGFRGPELERLGEAIVRLGSASGSPEFAVDRVLDLIDSELPHDRVFQDLDALQNDPAGSTMSPGGAPVDDPARRRDRGVRPDDSGGSYSGHIRPVDGGVGDATP